MKKIMFPTFKKIRDSIHKKISSKESQIFSISKKLLTAICVVVFLVVAVAVVVGFFLVIYDWYYWQSTKNFDFESYLLEHGKRIELPESLDTSDWKTYISEEFGFEFKYPEDLVVEVLPTAPWGKPFGGRSLYKGWSPQGSMDISGAYIKIHNSNGFEMYFANLGRMPGNEMSIIDSYNDYFERYSVSAADLNYIIIDNKVFHYREYVKRFVFKYNSDRLVLLGGGDSDDVYYSIIQSIKFLK